MNQNPNLELTPSAFSSCSDFGHSDFFRVSDFRGFRISVALFLFVLTRAYGHQRPHPPLGDSISQVTILRWIKNDGDYLRVDEPFVELETDKANTELQAQVAGVLHPSRKVGDTIKVGEIIATIDDKAAAPRRCSQGSQTCRRRSISIGRRPHPQLQPRAASVSSKPEETVPSGRTI